MKIQHRTLEDENNFIIKATEREKSSYVSIKGKYINTKRFDILIAYLEILLNNLGYDKIRLKYEIEKNKKETIKLQQEAADGINPV